MGRLARQLEDLYTAIRSDIFEFCRWMNFAPTWQQAQLLRIVQREKHGPPEGRKKRVAVKSGQGPGKTTVSVIIGIWCALQVRDGLTVVTAPSMRQCKDVWLAEARRLMAEADPILQRLIVVTKSRVIIGGRRDWGCWTVTASKEVNAQGYHHPNLTFIVEEASGVDRPFIEQIKGTLSNPNALHLMIGNPNTRDCAFFDCFNLQRDAWHTLTFNAEDTARDYPLIVSPERNRALELEYGRESDVYKVRVLGEFPSMDPNCVMSSEDLEACSKLSMHKLALERAADGRLVRKFGMDFARFGGDENTVYRRLGNAIVEGRTWARTDPNAAVDAAFRMQYDAHWGDEDCEYIVDAGGMGQGLMRRFYQAGKRVLEFHNNGTPMDPRMYANKITEAYFTFAKRARARAFYIPPDPRLIQQLSTRQYFVDKHGRLVLETKDDYVKRGFDSPDRADGLVLAAYDAQALQGHVTGGATGRDLAAGIRVRVSG